MNDLTKSLILALVGTFLFAQTTYAASVSVDLDQSNRPIWLPSGQDYFKVTVSDGADGDIDFLVEPLQPLRDLAVSDPDKFGVQGFSFNFGSSGAGVENLDLPDGWNVGAYPEYPFGLFDVTLKVWRENRADPLAFSITGVDGDTPTDYLTALSQGESEFGNYVFEARIGGLEWPANKDLCDNGNEEFEGRCLDRDFGYPAKFAGGTVVPIPATLGLLLSATAVLGGLGFRRRGRA